MPEEQVKKVYYLKVPLTKHDKAFVDFLNERVKRVFFRRIRVAVDALIETLRRGKEL